MEFFDDAVSKAKEAIDVACKKDVYKRQAI